MLIVIQYFSKGIAQDYEPPPKNIRTVVSGSIKSQQRSSSANEVNDIASTSQEVPVHTCDKG